jgi:DNA invertase Pin-like site-specific DNA recombinase
VATGKFVVYLRVSTQRQGRSGLGLEAQRAAIDAYLNGGNWQIVAEYTEVESGKSNDRPKLAEAFKACRLYGARLLIAKLDRLSRDAAFLMGLERAGIQFVAADMPEANEMTIGIMAVVAQGERKMISARTKAALEAAKVRGTRLGGFRRDADGKPLSKAPTAAHAALSVAKRQARAAERAVAIEPIIQELREAGIISLGGIADALTARGIPTSRGLPTWRAEQVARLLERVNTQTANS